MLNVYIKLSSVFIFIKGQLSAVESRILPNLQACADPERFVRGRVKSDNVVDICFGLI